LEVEITDIYYIKGADDLERVKVSYLINLSGVRIKGQVFMDPYPLETLQSRITPAVEEDLSKRTEVIEAVREANKAYVGQKVDIDLLLEEG